MHYEDVRKLLVIQQIFKLFLKNFCQQPEMKPGQHNITNILQTFRGAG